MKRRLLILAFLSVAAGHAQELTKVTLVPHWSPQAQFAGFYVGRDVGIYRKYGIDLDIITGGPKVSSGAFLKEGKADFALMWLTNAIQMKAAGARIVNIAQLVNRSALMLVAKKSTGIRTPQDLEGKTVGMWGGDFQIQPLAFFKKYNVKVRTVMQGSSINLFFFDGIDVTSAMWYNEYHTILNSGFQEDELTTFFFADHGLDFPEEGIYCDSALAARNPHLCAQFVRATLEAWQYAYAHPDEAIRIVEGEIIKARLPHNRAHQVWMLHAMKDLMFPSRDTGQFEPLLPDRYMLVAQQLKEGGLIARIPRFEDLYTPTDSGRNK